MPPRRTQRTPSALSSLKWSLCEVQVPWSSCEAPKMEALRSRASSAALFPSSSLVKALQNVLCFLEDFQMGAFTHFPRYQETVPG